MADFETDQGASDGAFSAAEMQTLVEVERAILGGWELQQWWQRIDDANAYGERFDLATPQNPSPAGFGFFEEAELTGALVPVMGSVQEQVFDRLKLPPAAVTPEVARWTGEQLREFVLGYFLRVSGCPRQRAYPGENGTPPAPPYLQPFSWREGANVEDCGFRQLYYKRKDGLRPMAFAPEERYDLVDLREIGKTYEWVVLEAQLFDFKLVFAPFGDDNPHGTLPASEPSRLVLHEAFLTDEPPADDEATGRYGFGFAILPASEESLLAHGLGRFDAAFQSLRFEIGSDGEIAVRSAFVANRPRRGVQLDPVDLGLQMADRASMGAASSVIEPMQRMWSRVPMARGIDVMQTFIDTANLITRGGAARRLGVSKKQLHKNFLVAQFARTLQMVESSLPAWRQVPDWLDRESLPDGLRPRGSRDW